MHVESNPRTRLGLSLSLSGSLKTKTMCSQDNIDFNHDLLYLTKEIIKT
jgi:hypothetical protein